MHFALTGNYLGREKTFNFKFDLRTATTRNAFVPRLWAARKIAVLVDAIRQMGANGDPAIVHPPAPDDPRLKELVDEIVRLSKEFGILTEYTSFLAREGTDLADLDKVLREANKNFVSRAMRTRSGFGAVSQSLSNLEMKKAAPQLNVRNYYVDDKLQRVEVSGVQQIGGMAFFKRGNRWVDSRLVENEEDMKPDRVIEIGSKEHMALAEELAKEGRQGAVSLPGEILLEVDGKQILCR